MTDENKKNWMMVEAVFVVLLGLMIFGGCKKKSEPAPPAETAKQAATAVVEQTTCPVMGGAINKDLFTEYKGKKVYFCCPACKGEFEKNPEKYVDKLPQFKS
ncbi:MAG TPA: YHS domain-containing protein [Sedimentisphaerales bacterium]|nr:YHS domain-containing protein [Sedimentisphaerales bacterium]